MTTPVRLPLPSAHFGRAELPADRPGSPTAAEGSRSSPGGDERWAGPARSDFLRRALAEGYGPAAVAVARAWVLDRPDHPEAWAGLREAARAARRGGTPALAGSAARRASSIAKAWWKRLTSGWPHLLDRVEDAPEEPATWLAVAELAGRRHWWEVARQARQAVADLAPGHLANRRALLELSAAAGDWAAVSDLAQACLAADPADLAAQDWRRQAALRQTLARYASQS